MTEVRSQNKEVRSQKSGVRRQSKEQIQRNRYIISVYMFTVFCLLNFIFPLPLEASSSVNKRFVYYIYWSGIRGGTAVMDYETTPSGFIISTRATSAPIISIFYKVDDFAESTIYPDGYPERFIMKTQEGRHKRDKATYFEPRIDNKPQKVIYHNNLEDEKIEFLLNKPAHDPLSAFNAMTKMSLEAGHSEFIDIFDSKKVWHTEVLVLRKEKVRVQSREFNTILVKPLMKSEGIFRRTGDMFIWVTDDDRKIPVLFKSKAVIGTFTVELAEGDF
ncbi:MAG: DUF3108 domain-containing protein [Nitrospirae bacterium]|nr:DUF3108 domain-containing protein [Nitrospirota bacterium]